MIDNFIDISLFYFSSIITLSTYVILGKLIIKDNNNNFFDKIIFGFILISLISLIINFIYPLNKLINTFFQIIVIGSIFFSSRKSLKIDEIKKILLISILVLILVSFDTENRPDAYLYHLPYSQILNEYKIIVGISNLHERFAHISIFQYIASFNYTLFSKPLAN